MSLKSFGITAVGLLLSLCLISFAVAYPPTQQPQAQEQLPDQSFMKIVIDKPFSETMQQDMQQKDELQQRQQVY